jgi:hypothetical protein
MKRPQLPRLAEERRLDLIWIGALFIAVIAGAAIVRGQLLLAILPILLLLGLLLVSSLSLAGWCVLLLLTTVASRGVAQTFHLPSAVIFLHYPAVLAFAYVASGRGVRGQRGPAGRWMMGFLAVTALSSVVNLTNVFRIVLFVLILGEPLAVIWAIHRWGADEATERRVLRAFWWLLAIQIPIGLWQGLTLGWQDPVQGTLVGSGAGAHELGALLAIGMFVCVAGIIDGRYPRRVAPIVVIAAMGMMVASGATQVLLLSTASLPLVLLVDRKGRRPVGAARQESRARRWLAARARGTRLAMAAVIVIVGIVGPVLASHIVHNITQRIVVLGKLDNFPEVTVPLARAGLTLKQGGLKAEGIHLDPGRSLAQALVGSGPGTTSSRAALLLVPTYEKGGSLTQLLANLPVKPTKLAGEIAVSSAGPNGGSLEEARSEILAVVGDLGVIGFVGLVLLFVGITRAAQRAGSWLAPVVAAALTMTFLLSFIDSWLEYPEFALPLAIVVGLATSPHRRWVEPERLGYQRDRVLGSESSAHPDRA